MSSIQLFELKNTVTLDDYVWDVVTCKDTQGQHFLCGPERLTLKEFHTLLEEWGIFIQKGRKDTRSYMLPFPGLHKQGKPMGVFVKVYLEDRQVARARKEYDAMIYLGQQPMTFPNIISSKNFPAPELLFDRILILPLVLSTVQLKHFCLQKSQFYNTHFNLTIDLDFAMPVHQKTPRLSNKQKVITYFKQFALDLLLRKQLELCSYIHGDAVDVNIVMEDGCNLVHRLTGVWPHPQSTIGFECSDPQQTESILIHAKSLPVLIDYDTVSFPSINYFQNMEDYFSETPYILKSYHTYDVIHDYLHQLTKIIPFIRKCVVPIIAMKTKPCCVTYFKEHEVLDPPIKTECLPHTKSDKSFHTLHTEEASLGEDDKHKLQSYVSRMSSYMIGVLRIFDMTLEDPHLTLDNINKRILSLYRILACNPLIYYHEYRLPIQIK